MIVVSGATGRLGGAVLAELLKHLPAEEVGASTTRPDELTRFSEAGVRVRRGDFDDPVSLAHSFDGADRLLLVSAPRHGEAAIAAHRVAIDAARDAGVGRLFYTSHVGADALSPFPPAVTHAATEVMLRESGIAFTALRNGFYADTPLRLVRGAAESGVLRVPADAPVSWTMHRDLAPGIAALLMDAAVDIPAINLTAGQAMDMAELAEAGRRILGRAIRHEQITDEDFTADLVANGAPAIAVTMTLGIFLASRQRHLGIVDPALTKLLGRPTTPLGEAIPEDAARN